MLGISLEQNSEESLKVLCLGAHADDIEIGCGGTILKLARNYQLGQITWVVFSANEQRSEEALNSANRLLSEVSEKVVRVENFRDGFFPWYGADIKCYFETLRREIQPDIIFTHHRNDLHQDHRLLADLTWNTYRDHLILEYEIPKYDGDLGSPNVFVHLDDELCRAKIDCLMDCFLTQRDKKWFSEDTFRGLMRIRGIESASPADYAEAFHARKIIL